MQSVIGKLDGDVMRMLINDLDEPARSHLLKSECPENTETEKKVDNMAIEKVKEYFRQYDIEDRVLEFDVSSATVDLAAEAVGCEPARIAKTLSFKVDEQPILIVCAGDAKIANPKYKAEFGQKAVMLSPQEAIDLIGHAVGGVCPFALNEGVKVYLDESLKRFDTVFPAAGSDNSAIELSPDELEKCSQGFVKWVDVCKGWND